MEQRSGDPEAPRSSDVMAAIRRHGVQTVAIVVCCTLVAIGLTLLRPRTYSASTSVLVGSPSDGAAPVTTNMATEKEVAVSPVVATKVVTMLGLDETVSQVLGQVGAAVPVDSNIVRISASASTPEDAQRLADGFASAYLSFRQESSLNGINAAAQIIDDRIQELTRRLRRAQAGASAAGGAGRSAEQTSIVAEITVLEQHVATAATTGLTPGRVIAPATPPLGPADRPLVANALLGAFLGLLVAVGAAIAMESMRARVRSSQDIESAARARVLGEVEMPRDVASAANGNGLVVGTPGPAANAFRTLRTNLLVALGVARTSADTDAGAEQQRTVAVVATHDDLDSAYVAANLAAVLATGGRRVAVISPSSGSRLTAMLHVDTGRRRLAGSPESPTFIHPTSIPNVSLTAAADGEDLALLDVNDAWRILADTARNANVALVAAPPLNAPIDGGSLVAASDAAILVTWDDAARDEIARARSRLDALGTRLLGIVVLHRPARGIDRREGRPDRSALAAPTDPGR